MMIDQIIPLVASIGACLSALAALFTIRQVSKQRESSYHPELIVSRTPFDCMSDPLSKGSIPDMWIDRSEEVEAQNLRKFFAVPLHNVGLGAAKNLNLKWSFQMEETVSKVNELAQKSLTPVFFEYKNNKLALRSNEMGEVISMWGNQNEASIDFVLPASIDKLPSNLVIPHAFIMIVSALVHFHFKASKTIALEGIPQLAVEIDFFDIGGKKHKTKISILTQIILITGEGENFRGYLEAKNVVE